ncbi:ATP-binding cassette domain-containing protein, partial [bacterium]|nr:ATP-binding cassette domain-containing protein [bacterium]
MLEVDEIHTFYGESHILFGLSIDITEKSEAVGILGRNGAGKTTTMKSIVGLVKVSSGKLRFEGQDITNNPPHTIAQKGIGYVPEDRRIFAELTVRENLIIGITRRDAIKRWTLDSVFDFF